MGRFRSLDAATRNRTISVTDTSARSIHPEEYVAYANWHRCRAVRKELLRATAGADQLMRIN